MQYLHHLPFDFRTVPDSTSSNHRQGLSVGGYSNLPKLRRLRFRPVGSLSTYLIWDLSSPSSISIRQGKRVDGVSGVCSHSVSAVTRPHSGWDLFSRTMFRASRLTHRSVSDNIGYSISIHILNRLTMLYPTMDWRVNALTVGSILTNSSDEGVSAGTFVLAYTLATAWTPSAGPRCLIVITAVISRKVSKDAGSATLGTDVADTGGKDSQ